MNPDDVKIIICDDHPLINEGLRKIISDMKGIILVGSVTNVAHLFEELQQRQTDIILLDINLPDGDGAEICLTIKKQFPLVKTLMISSTGDRATLIKAIRNGASGYLLKSATVDEIETAIHLVHRGGHYYSQEMQQLATSILSDTLQNEYPPVTQREKQILLFLKQGLNSQQIAEKLFISAFTVETHRKNLLAKFNVSKTIILLEKAKEMGLVS